MRLDIFVLILGYVLSQFYRAFLAVLAPVLDREIGVSATDLAVSSGLWFFSFAVMQVPVGIALDRIGPRVTASLLLAVGGAGGATIFALAQGPLAIHGAMVLIGIGCSPVLMACYFIFARIYTPAVFGTLAGMVIGFGSLGNIAGSIPLAMLVEAIGWRASLFGLAATTLAVAAALALVIRDPERVTAEGGARGSILDLMRLPGFWAILPLMAVAYAPAASIRGLWAGPMLSDIYDADSTRIGTATLAMGLAMVAGNFAYGPLDRLFGTRKWVVFWGNALAAVALGALALNPDAGFWAVTALFAALGLLGSSFPAIMAHGRAFFPPHLIGRGVTFLNMFGIGGAGILQFGSGAVFGVAAQGTPGSGAYSVLMAFFLAPLLIGLLVYLLSRETPH